MKADKTIYSAEFKQALDYCKEHKLFLGFGNLNAKILILGKEHFSNHSYPEISRITNYKN